MNQTQTDARPREAVLMEMVFPDHTNHLNTLFGGQALAWMDKAAFKPRKPLSCRHPSGGWDPVK